MAFLVRGNGVGASRTPALAATQQPEKSIAVLPFLDLTPGMKEEEFADGMTEELIDRFSKISGLRVPAPIKASPDGALFYDSVGGEPLGVRLTGTTGCLKFTLYRRVPDSGLISVTLALTGIGTVYFDDIRIEPEVPSAPTVQTAGK